MKRKNKNSLKHFFFQVSANQSLQDLLIAIKDSGNIKSYSLSNAVLNTVGPIKLWKRKTTVKIIGYNFRLSKENEAFVHCAVYTDHLVNF